MNVSDMRPGMCFVRYLFDKQDGSIDTEVFFVMSSVPGLEKNGTPFVESYVIRVYKDRTSVIKWYLKLNNLMFRSKNWVMIHERTTS